MYDVEGAMNALSNTHADFIYISFCPETHLSLSALEHTSFSL